MKRSGKITDLFQLRKNKLPKTTDTDNIGNIESVENENLVSTSKNFDSQDIGSYINLREKNIILNDLKREQLLCYHLQTVNSDLTAACDHVQNIVDALSNLRENSDSNFKLIYDNCEQILKDVGSEMTIFSLCRKTNEPG